MILSSHTQDEKQGDSKVSRETRSQNDPYPQSPKPPEQHNTEQQSEERFQGGNNTRIMITVPIGDRRIEPPIAEWPEVLVRIVIMEREVAQEVGEGGQAKEHR